MNLQDIMNQISNLGAQIRQSAASLAQAAQDSTVTTEELEKKQAALAAMQTRMSGLQASYDAMKGEKQHELQPAQPEEKKGLRDILSSNEYARAFAYALRNGMNRRTARNDERTRILYDALTESGGATPGEDGGFLVPIDIDNQINELKRELNPLAPLFSEEVVSAPTGWRVIDTAPTTPMPAVNEMGTIVNNGDQPVFGKVSYTLTKYALRIPVSNELLADEVANLMGYLSRWFARKLVLTENSLLLGALKTLTPAAMGSASINAASALKTILNKTLDPAISVGAVILTNQSGFEALDQLTDGMERGLLQPDPTNATIYRAFGRRIVVVSNGQLPDDTGSKAPFFVGDFKAFGTLFRRGGFEVASTDIGGNAWATDSTEVRGIARLAVTKFDAAAAVYRQLALS